MALANRGIPSYLYPFIYFATADFVVHPSMQSLTARSARWELVKMWLRVAR